METVAVNKKSARMVAHRGLSLLNVENTAQAFEDACARSHYGVECDVHVTADGKYVIFHDDETGRMCDKNITVEKSDFAELRELRFKAGDFNMPTLAELLSIVSESGKHAFIELKNPMDASDVRRIVSECKAAYDLNKITFISFDFNNLVKVRAAEPKQDVMYLCCDIGEDTVRRIREHGFGLDVEWKCLDEDAVKRLHADGISVNCWTCDDKAAAERLAEWGVDYITTDILE